jgi:hypothetical protein
MLSSTKRTELGNKSPHENLAKELHKTVNVLKAKYSFAVQGGAIGDIVLLDDDGNPAVLPDDALILQAIVDVITPATSGGSATVALKAQSAADLLGATAVASVTGILAGVPVDTAATSIKLTADRTVKATVAVAALTAGVFNVFIRYVLSD